MSAGADEGARMGLAAMSCVRVLPLIAALGLAAGGLGGCTAAVEAPADAGVCWHMVPDSKGAVGGRVVGKYRFFPLASNIADLEHCAGALETMRVRFLGMGGSQHEVDGAYQGQFLFDDPRGVFSSTSLDVTPFPMLKRTDDGRLVPQGANIEP